MRRCKDCKYGRWSLCVREETYNKFTDKTTGVLDRRTNTNGICKYYVRKRWKLWAPKITLIVCLLLGGCSQTTATYKDGVATISRTRFLMTEDIDSFSYDARDGSFTLDGYRSDMTRMIDLVDRLTKRNDESGKKAVEP